MHRRRLRWRHLAHQIGAFDQPFVRLKTIRTTRLHGTRARNQPSNAITILPLAPSHSLLFDRTQCPIFVVENVSFCRGCNFYKTITILRSLPVALTLHMYRLFYGRSSFTKVGKRKVLKRYGLIQIFLRVC